MHALDQSQTAVTAKPTHSWAERALHRVAFASVQAQMGLADLGRRAFRRQMQAVTPGPPVFVTALPRAGTTVLLDVLASCAEFASPIYRDLPFVLCPLLWHRLSRRFQRTASPRERFHGDGILVSHDSPEAFEEVIWRAFFPEHYGARSIRPWASCRHAEFEEFFAAHRHEVVTLRGLAGKPARRYVSKNNGNIARVPALLEMLPEATVLLLFRDPLQHAHSLLEQHLRFCALHDRDPFARRYMRDIGHFDFGRNLLPIDFDGWLGDSRGERPAADGLAFWLDYWTATYRQLLRVPAHPRIAFVAFEELAEPACHERLVAQLAIADRAEFHKNAARLRPPRPQQHDASALSGTALATAADVHAALRARARA